MQQAATHAGRRAEVGGRRGGGGGGEGQTRLKSSNTNTDGGEKVFCLVYI